MTQFDHSLGEELAQIRELLHTVTAAATNFSAERSSPAHRSIVQVYAPSAQWKFLGGSFVAHTLWSLRTVHHEPMLVNVYIRRK